MHFASNMDALLRERLHENSFIYKRSLDRIIAKYSKLQYEDAGLEVDLNNTNTNALERYMRVSKAKLNKLESKSLTDLQEESITVQNITRSSQLDFTCQDGGTECDVSVTQFSFDDGMARSDTSQLTVSSLDESEQKFSETENQPEDQDEELEMTLRRHGSSFLELYPSMINRIERAWHRRTVSEAAGSVLRRYRRWRQQLNRSNVSCTFPVTLRHTDRNPRKMNSKMQHEQSCSSLQERQRATRSPLPIKTNLQALQVQQPSPERQSRSLRRQQPQPILIMDLSGQFEASKPKDVSLNETFTVCELPHLREQPCTYPASPSRPCYPGAKASLDLSLRSKRLSLSGHPEESNRPSVFTSQVAAVKERPDIYGSPVRQSPIKARMMGNLSRSPQVFSRSPKDHTVESFYSREPTRPSAMSPSRSSPSQKPAVPLRRLYPQDSNLSPQPHMHSPQPGRPRLRRHLSFDSSLPPIRIAFSPKKLDKDFMKLYHKFVCQGKSSSFNGLPCRLCARSPGVVQSHSSSALAALALSPHRSVLRKRHREVGWDGRPQSKRSRAGICASSPGSKRHGNEMLRRCLSGSSKHSMFYKFSNQQPAASAHQEAWTRLRCPASAAEFSGLGASLDSSFANAHSPRKW